MGKLKNQTVAEQGDKLKDLNGFSKSWIKWGGKVCSGLREHLRYLSINFKSMNIQVNIVL